MAILNGFTKDTAKNLQLDAGILVKELETPGAFNGELTENQKLGATEGGASFTATPTVRNIFEGIDGAKGNYKDGNVIDGWEIKLTATLKEMTAENFKLALGSGTITPASEGKFDSTTAKMVIESTDYLSNICWLGTQAGSEDPIIIELKNVMNINGLTFTVTDKGTGTVELELQAHFDITKPNEVPFTIYTPKAVTV